MKAIVLSLAGVMLAAGCSQNEQAFVDNLVRQAVANSGVAQEVAMTRQSDHNFTGTVTARRADGQILHFDCTANREGTSNNYRAQCLQQVDAAFVDTMKNEIRQGLTRNGAEVVSVELTRQDNNRMTGFVTVRGGGETARVPCEATRESPTGAAFRWQCGQPDGQAAAQPAPAGEGAQPATEAPAEEQ